MRNLAWINGSVCNLSEASISLEDRGYLLGDGVYEIIRVYNKTPFYLSAHLERIKRSAREIRLPLPYSPVEIEAVITDLLKQSGCIEGYIYIQLTRGPAPRDHLFPVEPKPSMVFYVREMASPGGADAVKPGKCITLPDERWLNCYIKSTNLLPNVLARQKAAEAGAVEAILYRAGGIVTEATRSNVFAVIGDKVRTHPESKLILSGITRRIALDILEELDVPSAEEAFTIEDLSSASEVFLTSTTMEIKPVCAVDEKPVGNNKTGPVGRSVIKAFWDKIAEHCPKE